MIAVRLVLLALGQAAMVSGSSVVEFGCRNLSLHSALSHRTVARVLQMLRDEPDPLIDLVSRRQAGPGRPLPAPDPRSVRGQCPVAAPASWPGRRGTPGVPGARRYGGARLPGPRLGRGARRRGRPGRAAEPLGGLGRAAGRWPSTASPSAAAAAGGAGPPSWTTSPSPPARPTCTATGQNGTSRTGTAGGPGSGSTPAPEYRRGCPGWLVAAG